MRWKTQLCDSEGRVIRDLQDGHNMVTDWGMDQLPTLRPDQLINYLHLGSTTETLKRVASGESLTITYTDAANITLTSDTNFFEAGDVGRTAKVLGWPEMLITGFTSALEVTATARAGVWLPGFTPAASPSSGHTDFGVHYTSVPTLAAQFTKFNTYDTASTNNNAELNDSSNSRTIHQRIFLSSTVSGSPWTINEMGWSDGNASNNCFGKVNLGSPDTVPVGNKYRVTLQVFWAKTPIDLSAVSLDWGATVGTITADIRQERIGYDSETGASTDTEQSFNFLRPSSAGESIVSWITSAFTMSAVAWQGDAGFANLSGRTFTDDSRAGNVVDASYVAGSHTRLRTLRWPDAIAITSATGICAGGRSAGNQFHPWLTIRPTSGTITKPTGYWIELAFDLYWTRELLN